MGETTLQAPNGTGPLMVQVLDRENLVQALKRVQRNKGASGVGGMAVAGLPDDLEHHWPDLEAQLLDGSCCPQPALRAGVPKPGGRKRKLGIPTVIGRLAQQAMAQAPSRIWEPRFHPNSYGSRPLRSARQAVEHAQSETNHGKRWVADIDFDSFFGRANHGRLMQEPKAVTDDKTLLRLDELDWELGKRGPTFVRYADDCQVFVGSRRAGERVKQSTTAFAEDALSTRLSQT